MEAKIIPFPVDRVREPQALNPEISFDEAFEKYIFKNPELQISLLQAQNEFAGHYGEIKDFNAYEIGSETIHSIRKISYFEPSEESENEDILAYELAKEWGDRDRAVAVLCRTVQARDDSDVSLIEFIGTLAHMTFDEAYANWHEVFNENLQHEGMPLGFREPYLFLLHGDIEKNNGKVQVISREPVMIPLSRIELICYIDR